LKIVYRRTLGWPSSFPDRFRFGPCLVFGTWPGRFCAGFRPAWGMKAGRCLFFAVFKNVGAPVAWPYIVDLQPIGHVPPSGKETSGELVLRGGYLVGEFAFSQLGTPTTFLWPWRPRFSFRGRHVRERLCIVRRRKREMKTIIGLRRWWQRLQHSVYSVVPSWFGEFPTCSRPESRFVVRDGSCCFFIFFQSSFETRNNFGLSGPNIRRCHRTPQGLHHGLGLLGDARGFGG